MFDDFCPMGRMFHFGMELHAEIFSLHVADGCIGTVSAFCQRNEALWHARDAVAV